MPAVVHKTVLLIGYAKAGPFGNKGQIVSAEIGSPQFPNQWTELAIGEGEGEYLHGRTKSPYCWWYSKQMLEEGDLVRISTKVGIVGTGPDEDRTMTILYSIAPKVGLMELTWKGIGYKDFPLAKGYLSEISRTSLANERIVTKLTPLLSDDFGPMLRE